MPSKFAVLIMSLATYLSSACGSELTGKVALTEGIYNVTSDCSDATQKTGSTKLKRKSDYNSVESDYDLKDGETFGFPDHLWQKVGPHKITATTEKRTCSTYIYEKEAKKALFTCFGLSKLEFECAIKLDYQRALDPA